MQTDYGESLRLPLTVDSSDVAECDRVLRRGSASFTWAARLLPARVRASAVVLYAFCRAADDAVDQGTSIARAIDALHARLERIYRGEPSPHPIDRALCVVVDRSKIPKAVFDLLLEGLLWDTQGRTYEGLDALLEYAARVASTVGVMMTLAMGESRRWVLERACELGLAMQLTNIVRDVGEDARRSRVYMPLDWLSEAGVDVEAWLKAPAPLPGVSNVARRMLEAADGYYTSSESGIHALAPDCRMAVGAARLIYADISRSIAKNDFDTVRQRAYTRRRRKAWLLLKATAFVLPSSSLEPKVGSPPVAVRTLVDSCASR